MTALQKALAYLRKLYRSTPKPMEAIEVWRKKRKRIFRTEAAMKWARQMQEHAKTRRSALKWKAIRFRYKRKLEYLRTHKDPITPPNLVSFDGRQVPGWIAQILQEARASGVWKGTVFSGYRSPAYSESLCIAICGAPSCPGTCGGAASNHACPPTGKGTPFEGAVDVTDAFNLRRYCENHNKPLIGGGRVLTRDVPHFSHSGR